MIPKSVKGADTEVSLRVTLHCQQRCSARGVTLASVYAALRVLDSGDTLHLQTSICGMAGCPYGGNGRAAMMIATEDLMHMLEEMGIYTGASARISL